MQIIALTISLHYSKQSAVENSFIQNQWQNQEGKKKIASAFKLISPKKMS